MGKNVGLTEIDKNEIINLYKKGTKCQEIGNIFGISKVRVSQIAREFGLKRQDKILDYSQEEVCEMYNMYLNGCTSEEISEKYGFNRASVYNLFKKYNLDLDDDRYRKYEVNDFYFDNIDAPNKAYILGFLWADGHNNTKKGIIEMRLQENDKHILEDISTEIHNNRPLYFCSENRPNHQDTYRIYITSRHISDVLLGYGMCSNKTYVLQWPTCINGLMIPHFLRGFTDGDGSIGNYNMSWAGTEMMLSKIKYILNDTFGIDAKIRDTKTEVIKTLSVTKKIDTIKILNWIYKDADLKLNRKFLKYQELINS